MTETRVSRRPPSVPGPSSGALAGDTCREEIPPLAKGEVLRLVQVRRAPPDDVYSGPIGSWQDLGDFVRAIVEFLDNELNLFEDIRLFIHSMEDLLRLRIPMLFLKQFHDAVQPRQAAYQRSSKRRLSRLECTKDASSAQTMMLLSNSVTVIQSAPTSVCRQRAHFGRRSVSM